MKIKWLGLMVVVFALSACSTTSDQGYSKGGDNGVADASQVNSQGIGQDAQFAGQDAANKLKAPHNQTYYFSFDNSTVTRLDYASLQAQARYLTNNPGARVLLAGNTDERGSREYNIALGERRATSVADILKLDGVNPSQIRVISYGQEKPASLGHNEDAYRLNRRVVLTYEATA